MKKLSKLKIALLKEHGFIIENVDKKSRPIRVVFSKLIESIDYDEKKSELTVIMKKNSGFKKAVIEVESIDFPMSFHRENIVVYSKNTEVEENPIESNPVHDEFLEISFIEGTEDHRIFSEVINQGIDSYLEGFTDSKFSEDNGRIYCLFHISELGTLVRRLEELEDEAADSWANDIKETEEYEKFLDYSTDKE